MTPFLVGNWFLEILLAMEGNVLPRRLSEIGRGREPAGYVVTGRRLANGILSLQSRGIILYLHGGKREHFGHHCIKVVATGKVFKTENCPFDL